jgi:YtkA-like
MSNPIRNTAALSLLLSAALSACATPPANLDVSREKTSVGGRYVVSLAPPAAPPAINQLHSWTVSVKDTRGNPVSSAMFKVGGGMPQHGHGFPTKPRVTREVESGTYLVEGMKFSMPGWWDIAFDIQGLQGRDQVRFNTIVAPMTARREGTP